MSHLSTYSHDCGYFRGPTDALLDMVARKCAQYMRTGGGSITGVTERNQPSFHRPRTTPEQRKRVLALAQSGELCTAEIARQVGLTQSATYTTIRRAGLRVRDGRKVA